MFHVKRAVFRGKCKFMKHRKQVSPSQNITTFIQNKKISQKNENVSHVSDVPDCSKDLTICSSPQMGCKRSVVLVCAESNCSVNLRSALVAINRTCESLNKFS